MSWGLSLGLKFTRLPGLLSTVLNLDCPGGRGEAMAGGWACWWLPQVLSRQLVVVGAGHVAGQTVRVP